MSFAIEGFERSSKRRCEVLDEPGRTLSRTGGADSFASSSGRRLYLLLPQTSLTFF